MPADSLAKASTPEPFSRSKTSNWVARGGGLPPYIQHVAHDLVEKRGKSESQAIAMAIGIVKRWARGGGNVDQGTRAAAAKAVAQWEALKAKSHVKEGVWEAVAELAARGSLQEVQKVPARRRTGQFHRITKGVEAQVKSHEDLMGEIAACGHAGSGG